MEELLTPEQVAKILHVEAQTLRRWRQEQIGPKWIKIGKEGPTSPVRYTRAAVDDYIRAQSGGQP